MQFYLRKLYLSKNDQLDKLKKIIHFNAHLFKLMIHPSNQQLFRGQLHQFLYVLPLLQEVDEPGHCCDGDLLEQVHLDELPQQSQDQPFLTLYTLLGNSFTDNIAMIPG